MCTHVHTASQCEPKLQMRCRMFHSVICKSIYNFLFLIAILSLSVKLKLLQNERLYFFASEQMYKSSRGSNNYFPRCKRQGSAVKDRKGTSFGVLGAKSTRRTDKEAETKAKADIAVT